MSTPPAGPPTTGRDLAGLPKAHLHVHLESAIRPDTLREIGAANGIAVPDRVGTAFTGGFPAFAEHNALIRACLRRPADFTRIAREFCADEAAQGTRYAEVTVTAAAHGERLGDPELPLVAVLQGLAEGRQAYGVQCRVILDHSRRRPVARAAETVRLATRYAGDGVVGVGLAGEERYPLAPFRSVLDAARAAGLRMVHHAGEACGPESIREALTVGGAQRLGHGIRVLDDDDLTAELRERRIPLEVCPTSNVALGFAPSLAAHPLHRLRAAGLVVTLNADIPAPVGTSLLAEYQRVRDTFGYDDATLAELARAGFDASFAPAATKERLHRETDAWLAASNG